MRYLPRVTRDGGAKVIATPPGWSSSSPSGPNTSRRGRRRWPGARCPTGSCPLPGHAHRGNSGGHSVGARRAWPRLACGGGLAHRAPRPPPASFRPHVHVDVAEGQAERPEDQRQKLPVPRADVEDEADGAEQPVAPGLGNLGTPNERVEACVDGLGRSPARGVLVTVGLAVLDELPAHALDRRGHSALHRADVLSDVCPECFEGGDEAELAEPGVIAHSPTRTGARALGAKMRT